MTQRASIVRSGGAGRAGGGGPPSPTFGAVGDDEGLVVLVRTGRTWFPTHDTSARPAEVHV